LLLIITNSEWIFPKKARPKCGNFLFWKSATGSKNAHFISISFFRNLTLKINQWASNESSTKISTYVQQFPKKAIDIIHTNRHKQVQILLLPSRNGNIPVCGKLRKALRDMKTGEMKAPTVMKGCSLGGMKTNEMKGPKVMKGCSQWMI
jgi:hypothetical protein